MDRRSDQGLAGMDGFRLQRQSRGKTEAAVGTCRIEISSFQRSADQGRFRRMAGPYYLLLLFAAADSLHPANEPLDGAIGHRARARGRACAAACVGEARRRSPFME